VTTQPPEQDTPEASDAASHAGQVAPVDHTAERSPLGDPGSETMSGTASGVAAPASREPSEDIRADLLAALRVGIEEEQATAAQAEAPSDSSFPVLLTRFNVTAQAVTLTMLVAALFLMFLLIEPSPRWLVLLGTAVSALALDGTLRAGRREAFAEGGLDTTPLLLVPTLYVLAMPVFLEHNTRGYWAPLMALLAAGGYGALVTATLSSVREHDAGHALGRFVVAGATYVVAFALFSLVFRFEVERIPAAVAVGLVALLLAAELLREGEIDPAETVLFAAVTGLVVAQARWIVDYLPVDGYLAALGLLLTFYFVAGVLHSHVVRQLSRTVAIEYAAVTAAGLVFILGARVAGLT
jgi:hypothetical protein